MDPAKLSLLTDFLVNFMEKSHNGVILVDGIEYLITSNDFQRVLRAVDKLTETAMTSSIRLIVTLDPRALDEKDLAMFERDKEIVRPEASEPWKVIPEPI
jgi:archaellum biogenesis ATPase FlaH